MNNLIDFAKRELNYCFPDKDDELQQMVIENVLELIETFSNQGHSGLSAPYVLNLFHRLVFWKPLKPLTGEEDEWEETAGGNNLQQNKRYPAVFRNNHDNATAFDVKGKVFIDENGIGYTNHDSFVPITFPYEVPDNPEFVKEEKGKKK